MFNTKKKKDKNKTASETGAKECGKLVTLRKRKDGRKEE